MNHLIKKWAKDPETPHQGRSANSNSAYEKMLHNVSSGKCKLK